MDSASAYGSEHRRRPKMVDPVELENQPSPSIQFRRRPSHRSKCRSMSSLSALLSSNNTTTTSSSSSVSCFDNCHQYYHMSHNNSPISSSPALPFPSRIPFSWEKHPGIPKQQKQDSKKKLPLPPAAAITNNNGNQNHSSKRYGMFYGSRNSEEMMSSFREDPFLIAMVECSKDKHKSETRRGRRSIGSIITRHLSGRIGMINMNTSCKCSSTVSESSIIHLPSKTTTTTTTTTTYGENSYTKRDARCHTGGGTWAGEGL